MFYCHIEEFNNAEFFLTKSLNVRLKIIGENHCDTAISYSNLGILYNRLGRIEKSIECFSKSLNIRRKLHADENTASIFCCNNLGLLYYRKGDLQKSEEFYTSAYNTIKIIFGENHSESAAALNNLGELYVKIGDLKKGEEYLEKALINGRNTNKETHAAKSLNNLGKLFLKMGEVQKAEEIFNKTLNINKEKFGENQDFANSFKNIDELFERKELSAAPDVGWPDCFNSGLFICRPSKETYRNLLLMANSIGSFDGGDQGLLNQYFVDWSKGNSSRRLPFGYNLTFSSSYSYLPAFKHFRNSIKVVHFIGSNKPWSFHRFADGNVCPRGDYTADHLEFVQKWWSVHDSVKSLIRPNTTPTFSGFGHKTEHKVPRLL